MSKNSCEPKKRRRAKDGAISLEKISSSLVAGPAGGGLRGIEKPLSFALIKINTAILDLLVVGQNLVFSAQHEGLAAQSGRQVLGFVPSSLQKRVLLIVKNRYLAYISDLPHKTIIVTVESDHHHE